MKQLHNFLCRLFFYVLVLMFLNTTFGSWPDSPNPTFYLTYYGLPAFGWIALFEVVRFGYPRRYPAVADTAKLEELETRPLRNKLDK